MEPFEEWLTDSVDHPFLKQWAERLLDLGASWDTFRRSESDKVVDDLVVGGIPLLAARDICNLASEAIGRSDGQPLAIFWDLENMPIPSSISGRDVATRLKSVVASHGDLVQFRAYANIGLGLIPQQKRSDLQLSNCHIVDCPYSGRKEVADKMIIVDAMQFAFTHPEGATLCFVTGDVDYAYLLAVLQRPQWKTIVISKGTMQSMLHVNCDMKMRWESDVLQLRSEGSQVATKPGAPSMPSPFDASSESFEDSQIEAYHDLKTVVVQNDDAASALSLEALTIAEEWADDAELLRTIVRQAPEAPIGDGSESGRYHFARKSHVGNTLRQTNPARFPDRQAVKDFLSKAVNTGVVIEQGEGAFKTFRLPSSERGGDFCPVVTLSETAPVAEEDMPLRALQMVSSLPFILFAPWGLCPNEDKFPSQTFVQSSGKWAILMFPNLTAAQRAVAAKPWLRSGTLVDWRRAVRFKIPLPANTPSEIEMSPCDLCKNPSRKSLMRALSSDDSLLLCRSCCSLVESRSNSDKLHATECVTEMLEMMAENDDIYIAENILRKLLCLRWPSVCKTRQDAAVWIHDSVNAGAVIRFKRPDVKSKLVCCARLYAMAMAPFLPSDIDTVKEENHVVDMLWEKNGWMKRTEAIASLKETFETMHSPFMRSKCVFNAVGRKKFFFAKGILGQTLGLTLEDAQKALEIAYPMGEVDSKDPSVEVNKKRKAAIDGTLHSHTSTISKDSRSSHQESMSHGDDGPFGNVENQESE